jgi:hypothetical protein
MAFKPSVLRDEGLRAIQSWVKAREKRARIRVKRAKGDRRNARKQQSYCCSTQKIL